MTNLPRSYLLFRAECSFHICILKEIAGDIFPPELIQLIIVAYLESYGLSDKQLVCYEKLYMFVSGGKLYSWGDNMRGMLGLPGTQSCPSPKLVEINNVKSVSCNDYHAMAITSDGHLMPPLLLPTTGPFVFMSMSPFVGDIKASIRWVFFGRWKCSTFSGKMLSPMKKVALLGSDLISQWK